MPTSAAPLPAVCAVAAAQVDLSWGLGRLFSGQESGSNGALDKVRQELTG